MDFVDILMLIGDKLNVFANFSKIQINTVIYLWIYF